MGEVPTKSGIPDEPTDPRSAPTGSARFFHPNAPAVLRADVAGISSLHPLPERIGHYRIIRIIGEGGMGMVLEAEQDKPKRIVALKVIRPGVAKLEMLRRFELESEMLGLLQHPGIAQVYEAGVFDVGGGTQPYFAMEFIRGKPLTVFAREHNLGTRERLQLMIKICEAVQHAHQKGIIHRDLKPGNILVVDDAEAKAHGVHAVGVGGGADARHIPQPKILDFGVARLTASDIQSTTLRTDIGQLIGTIPYMSPEQTEGDPRNLDTRSDVYALGVICYELLADRLPYDLQKKMIHEAVRVIREDDPTPLSSVNRIFRGDVETIVAKALEKDRDRRYQSATELASDIDRYLRNETLVARPTTQWYRFRKFAQRNRTLVGGVTATFLALIAGLFVSLYLVGIAHENEQKAKHEATQRGIAEKAEKQRADELAIESARAKTAEENEKQRADELEQVANFQSEMISDLDPQGMGSQLLTLVRQEVRAGLARNSDPESNIESELSRHDAFMAVTNATNIAVTSLDDNVLARAEVAARTRFVKQPAILASLLQTIATSRFSLGLYHRARTVQFDALDLRRSSLGDTHELTLQSLNSTAMLLQHLGDFAEAEHYQRLVLDLCEAQHGPDYVGTLSAMGNLAALLERQNKPQQAEPYFRQTMEGCKRVLGLDHVTTVTSICNFGFILLQLQRWSEAEQYLNEGLEACLLYLGEQHIQTQMTVGNLAQLYDLTGRPAESNSQHERAVKIARTLLGDNHPSTLKCISNYAMFLMRAGRYEQSELLAREACERSRETLGDSHVESLRCMLNHAQILQEQGKLGDAEPLFVRVLEVRRLLLGNDHKDTLFTIQSMANFLRVAGRSIDAEPYAREAVDGCRRVLGNQDPQTLRAINVLGSVLQSLGKYDDAEPYVREALDQRRATLGDDDMETLRSFHNYATLLGNQKHYEQAAQYFQKAIDGRTRTLSEDHPSTISSKYSYGMMLWNKGSSDEARPLLQAVVDGRSRTLHDHHPDLLVAMQNLSNLEREQRNFIASETLALEVMSRVARNFATGSKPWITAATHLVKLYSAWHAAEPGKGYDLKAAEWKAKLVELQAATQPAASQSESQPASSQPAAQSAATQATTSPGGR